MDKQGSTTYHTSIQQLIQSRSSWRSFSTDPIGGLDLKNLDQFQQEIPDFMGLGTIPIHIIKRSVMEDTTEKLGDYGMFKNAQYFAAGFIPHTLLGYVNYGYQLEHVVLKLYDMNLVSCWVGYFNRAFFTQFFNKKTDTIPAILIFGNPHNHRHLRERVGRQVVGAKKRKPFEQLFFNTNVETPLDYSTEKPIHKALEMVRLAPSSGNTQPWRVIQKDTTYHFYKIPVNKNYNSMGLHHVDMGIAFCHFDLTLNELGIHGNWGNFIPQGIEPPSQWEYIASWTL
jgi:hypothetical protein